MTYHGDPGPEDQATHAIMAALYKELDTRDLPTDPAFDAQTGLQQLIGRIRRDHTHQPQLPASGLPTDPASQEPAPPAPADRRPEPAAASTEVTSQRIAEARAPGRPSGGEQEFARFYREHMPRLAAYLTYQGATAHLAADIAQDAMTEVFRRWDTVKSPRAHAWTIAYRAFIRHALNEAEVPVAEVREPVTAPPRPGDAGARLEEQQQVLEVLRALPPRQRQVLALTFDGWTPAEIASLLGLDPPAVRASLMEARRTADAHLRRAREEP